jgi:hypothetical protein
MRTRNSRRRGRMPAMSIVPPSSPLLPSYPRGNPLTDTATLTDAAGTRWLVYVEPAPAEAPLRRSAAVLPGRRLRFDSLERSLVVSPIPAGSPFLPEERLDRLLAQARPLPPPAPTPAPLLIPARALRSLDLAGSAAGFAAAIRDAGSRKWRATAGLRRACARGLVQVVAPAVLLLVVVWEAMLVRPRARV